MQVPLIIGFTYTYILVVSPQSALISIDNVKLSMSDAFREVFLCLSLSVRYSN